MSDWKPGPPEEPGTWWVAAEDFGPEVIDVYLGDDQELYCDLIFFCGEPLRTAALQFTQFEHAPCSPPE